MADKPKETTIITNEEESSAKKIDEVTIKNMIHVIRGQQVILDSDLAVLYQVETKVLNQAVKRNVTRFPERYRFQLTEDEYANLKSQFVTSSLESEHGGRRKLPFAFTEQGIAMLSAVLRSEVAVRVSIGIMDAFVTMRRFLASNSLLFERINEVEVKQLEYQRSADEKFDKIFGYISEHEEVLQKVFFDGQIYDAFYILTDLIEKAEKNIVLVDNYVDLGTLNILSKKKRDVDATIYTLRKTSLSERDIEKFNQQYPRLNVKYTKVFHDRFLIVDDTKAYHIGASLKDAGRKCFAINLIYDTNIVKDILERLVLETEGGKS